MTRAGHSKKERETGQARVWSLRIRNVGFLCVCVCYLLRPFDCSANFNLNFCEPPNYSFLLFFMNINVKVKVKLFSAVRTTFEQVREKRAHKNANHSLSFVLLLHCNSSKFQLRFQFFLLECERESQKGDDVTHVLARTVQSFLLPFSWFYLVVFLPLVCGTFSIFPLAFVVHKTN